VSDDAVARSRRGLGAWVRSVGASTGRGVRRASPYGIYAFLTAAAVAPLAGPALGAAGEFEIALNQLGGMGTNHLATVMANAAGEMRKRGGPVSDEQWREALAEALASRLDGGRDEELVGEVRAVLRAVNGVECALAESAEHAEELHLALLSAAAALHGEFGEVRWALAEVRDLVARSHETIAEVQRELLARRARERADVRLTQRLLIGLTRMRRVLRQDAAVVPGVPSPYPGLTGFRVEDAPTFFGREEAVAELVAAVGDGPVLVVGASGAGKSSLLRAGLLPALADDAVPGSATWPSIVLTPGTHPLTELAARTASAARVAAVGLAERLRADPGTYGAFARQAAGLPSARLVVVIDQFEELFTLCTDPAERAAFVVALASARSAVVVLAVRGDFFERCAEYPELADAVAAPRVLGPMSDDDLRRAITAPAERLGVPVDAGLPGRLLADLGTRSDSALPLLAHALRVIWDTRGDHGMTLTGYHATGGIDQAVAASAEALYNQATPNDRRELESILPRMVTIVDDHAIARRRVHRTALPESLVGPWIDARLMTADGDTLQFSHEALLSVWPRLAAWITRDRARLADRQRLDDAARDWAAQGRPADLLYRGERLDVARTEVDLSDREREFVAASSRAKRRRTMLSGGFVVVLAVVAVLAVIASIVGASARADAERVAALSQSRQLAAESQTTSVNDTRAAMEMAVKAWAVAPTQEAHGALASASMLTLRSTIELADQQLTTVDIDPGGDLAATAVGERVMLVDFARGTSRELGAFADTVYDVGFSPDGEHLAASAFQADGVHIWHLTDNAPVVTLPAVGLLAWRPDGAALASVDVSAGPSQPTQIGVWDTATGERIALFGPTDVPVLGLAFDASGTRLAVSYGDGSVRLWDVRAGRLVATLVDAGGEVSRITASGTVLAAMALEATTVRLWNMADARRLPTIDTGDEEGSGVLALAPGGTELVLALGSTISRWDVANGRQTTEYAAIPDNVQTLAVSADDTAIVAATVEGTITRWKRADTWHTAGPGAAIGIAADPTTRQVTATYADGDWHTITPGRAISTERGKATSTSPRVRYGSSGPPYFLSANGVLERGDRHTEPDGSEHGGSSISVSPDGTMIAAVLFAPGNDNGPTSSRQVRVWSTADLAIRAKLDVPEALTVTITDDAVLVTTGANTALEPELTPELRRWSTTDFTELPTIPLPENIHAAASTQDGTALVAGGTKLHMIDLATGSVTRTFGDHPSRIRTLAVSPDGTIATGTVEDPILRLWKTDTDEPIASYTGHTHNSLNQVDFIDDGATVVSAGSDGSIGFWPTEASTALSAVCARLDEGNGERPPHCP
jgi:WD40 repeat protein